VPACDFADRMSAVRKLVRPATTPVYQAGCPGRGSVVRDHEARDRTELRPEKPRRAPRRSAERRARLQADARGNADHPWRAPHWPAVWMLSSEAPVRIFRMRLSALRPPCFYLGQLSCSGLARLGREQKTRRENGEALPCTPHPEVRAKRASKDAGPGASAYILRGSRCARAPQDEVYGECVVVCTPAPQSCALPARWPPLRPAWLSVRVALRGHGANAILPTRSCLATRLCLLYGKRKHART
jgi:hypothetical protein